MLKKFEKLLLQIFIFPQRKRQALRILAMLREPITFDNLLVGFRKKLSRLETLHVIERAIRDGAISWLDTGCASYEELEDVYLDHLTRVLKAYSESFSAGYWRDYKHMREGQRAFSYAACWNMLLSEVTLPTKRKFCRELYILSHRHENIPVTEEGIREHMVKCGLATTNEVAGISTQTKKSGNASKSV